MPQNQLVTEDGTVLDPKVLKVMRAIRQVESSGNYNAVGDGGASHGAFQYNEKTGPGWSNLAQKYLGNASATMDKANQNKVTYMRIKEWKDQGRDPEEIAALWNGASVDPQTGKYTYNNPEYGEKFRAALFGTTPPQQFTTNINQQDQEQMGGQKVVSGVSLEDAPRDTLGQKLSGRLADLGLGISRTVEGEQGIFSGTLQTGGAIAGGLLDVGGAAVRALTPDFIEKPIEKATGYVGTKLGETQLMQDIGQAWLKLEEEDPIVADNIRGTLNIVSVIPAVSATFKAMGLAKQGVATGTGLLFRDKLEKAAEQELTRTMQRTQGGTRKVTDYAGRNINPVGVIIAERALPEIEVDAKGIPRYNTIEADKILESRIAQLDDELDAKLQQATGSDLGGYVPLETMKGIAVARIMKEMKGSPDLDAALAKLDSDFASIGRSYGDMITLNELNNVKRAVRKSVNFDSPSLDRNVRYHIGQSIMKTVEDVATQRGQKEVREINRQMSELIEAQEALAKYINGKSVPENPGWRGIMQRQGGDVMTIAGESVGQSFGTPGVGAAMGRMLNNKLISGSKGAVSRLKTVPARRKVKKKDDFSIAEPISATGAVAPYKKSVEAPDIEATYTKSLPEVEQNLERIFGRSINVRTTTDTKKLGATPGTVVYGRATGNTIHLLERNKSFSEAVANHEGWHWFKRNLSDSKRKELDALESMVFTQRPDLVQKIRKDYGDISDKELGEEVMADLFAEYVRTGKTFSEKLAQFFKDSYDALMMIFGVRGDAITQARREFRGVKGTLKRNEGKYTVGEGANKQVLSEKEFKNFNDLSTKLLTKLEGKTTVSKQFISDLTNSPDLKQAERDLIRKALEDEGDKVNVTEFANKVKSELLPLKRNLPSEVRQDIGDYRYESVNLPEELRGPVANYSENIYQSPIKTSAGNVHFGNEPNYFAHTRVEDMADDTTRRVIEIQSDLFQKGRLESEYLKDSNRNPIGMSVDETRLRNNGWTEDQIARAKSRYTNTDSLLNERQAELSKLEPYRNTWHERIIREEVKKASQDGKTKLQFPTGETAMKIEGLGERNSWNLVTPNIEDFRPLKVEDLKVGQQVADGSTPWIITDVLGDGKFKAVPKSREDLIRLDNDARSAWFDLKNGKENVKLPDSLRVYEETFDISGKVDTNNPIYKFYEKEVGKYLKNKYNAQLVTDAQGVTWWELPLQKEYGTQPVEAFKKGLVPTPRR